MTPEELKQLQEEIHQIAVDHGWWDTEPDMDGIFANFHAEVSEAWEEYRNGHPANKIYFRDTKFCRYCGNSKCQHELPEVQNFCKDNLDIPSDKEFAAEGHKSCKADRTKRGFGNGEI